jgi:hypothetical protein
VRQSILRASAQEGGSGGSEKGGREGVPTYSARMIRKQFFLHRQKLKDVKMFKHRLSYTKYRNLYLLFLTILSVRLQLATDTKVSLEARRGPRWKPEEDRVGSQKRTALEARRGPSWKPEEDRLEARRGPCWKPEENRVGESNLHGKKKFEGYLLTLNRAAI